MGCCNIRQGPTHTTSRSQPEDGRDVSIMSKPCTWRYSLPSHLTHGAMCLCAMNVSTGFKAEVPTELVALMFLHKCIIS